MRTAAHTAVLELALASAETVSILDLQEDITKGQRVARYRVEGNDGGAWRELVRGTTIGYRRLERVAPTRVRALRLVIEDAAEAPELVRVGCFA